MLTGSCHCCAVQIQVATKPRRLTSCNCSICRRYGSLLGYYDPSKVTMRSRKADLARYVWGDRCIRFVRCAHCGCFMYWEPTDRTLKRMGINFRNFDPAEIATVRVRKFDGAKTWKFLD